MAPAAGQGALVLQVRSGDEAPRAAAARVGHAPSLAELAVERATIARLGADCTTPVGVRAQFEAGEVAVEAFVGLPDGSEWIRDRVIGAAGKPAALGQLLGPAPPRRRRPRHPRPRCERMSARAGIVYLVGAGPGEPGLMTARSLDLDRLRRRDLL